MLSKQYQHRVSDFIRKALFIQLCPCCLGLVCILSLRSSANGFWRLLALRYVNKTLGRGGGGGERLRLRVSGKVGAEDLDVLVNTLILCKLFHKRRASCCVSAADKHRAFLMGLLNQTAFVFPHSSKWMGDFFFLFFILSLCLPGK